MSYNVIIALDWAIISLSFFNTVAFVWLGLTVLLNAERRHFGTWAAGGGLLVGGLFFAGHSAVVGHDLLTIGPDVEFWWRASWLPVIGAPYLWYVVTAWYTGVLHAGRHRAWLVVATLLGVAAVASLLVANPLPSYTDVLTRAPVPVLRVAGLPVAVLIYPVYSTLCIILALGALRYPEASARFMGDEARRRARPWLIAASLVLLAVTVTLAVAVAFFLSRVESRLTGDLPSRTLLLMMAFDLLLSGLVAVAIVLIGRAIVSYEIFTGKALPRGGLFSHWRRSLVFAAGYAALLGLSLSLPGLAEIDPLYRLLLATVLMTLFYALLSWRSYADRERSMENLRPFVASPRLYERMLRPMTPAEVDIAAPFRALCADVLGARVAYLCALGPLAPLVGPPLAYPAAGPRAEERGTNASAQSDETPLVGRLSSSVANLAAQFGSPSVMCVPVDARRYGGAVWAIPLWSERGLIGALLLGDKRHGELYTQEEIEIARATGERLIDTRASAELARRLTALQRQRLAESQVVDQRTRRTLHDDVLPRLHTMILQIAESRFDGEDLAEQQSTINNLQSQLADVHRQIANLLHAMPATAAPEVARLGLIGALRQAIDGEFGGDFDAVTWRVEPEAERAAAGIPPLAAEVCFYAAREVARNAARYGRDGNTTRKLHLSVLVAWRNGLQIEIEDDGVGMGERPPRASGETVAPAGSGHGLGLHGTLMAVVGGTLTAESKPGAFTRVSLQLPEAAWM